ncbi:DEAD-domain-containing protein [Gonapodya prolifera JEL478]|uniref:RNA helicase n=1 Tax=Gonapodya prolifera (strain JEL478) TaxID=1344416 RepID=A0A139A7N4_GONPJ|nr:DEAD-domain-containing protein [Gonapodya prolifera JEL478]|eukprot:KXS12699.1 DEAD-domain-containing protein [Gonapodya prolifera JEL478]
MHLRPELLKGVFAAGFQAPSKIQEKAIPLLLHDPPQNLIGQSQSGTGKTATFTLAVLSRVDPTDPSLQAVILAPARELARQIMDVVESLGRFSGIKAALLVKEALKDTTAGGKVDAQILVATPGTVIDAAQRKRVIDMSKVKIFVLDEADNMLNAQGMGDQSMRVRGLIPRNQPVQVALFSATFPRQVRDFAERMAPNSNKLTLRQEELSVAGIKQFYFQCRDDEEKFKMLNDLYGLLTVGQSIIFVNRRDVADRIAQRMTADGHQVTALHGQLTPDDRDRVIDDFRAGRAKVLISTNVLSRGIDVLQVTIVINYDLPTGERGLPDPETYLHRIGRTGRFGRNGVSVNFVHDDRSRRVMEEISNYFSVEIKPLPTDDFELIEKTLKKAMK